MAIDTRNKRVALMNMGMGGLVDLPSPEGGSLSYPEGHAHLIGSYVPYIGAVLESSFVNRGLDVGFYLDILDSQYQLLGDGPITSAEFFEISRPMDRAGRFSTKIPVTDRRVNLVKNKRIIRCYTMIDGRRAVIGVGVIDTIDIVANSDGTTSLDVSGDDILRELTNRSLGFFEIRNGSDPATLNEAVTRIMDFAPDGWTRSVQATTKQVYASFAGDLILSGLNKTAEQTGTHFRLDGERKVLWFSNLDDCGVIALQATVADPSLHQNSDICIIDSVKETSDSYDLVTRIYPYGSGIGRVALDLFWCSDELVDAIQGNAGYVIDRELNFIESTTATAEWGSRKNGNAVPIERYLSYKEISPISNTDEDLTNAADYLAGAALEELRRSSQINKVYDISIVKLNRIVYPGQTIRVMYRSIVNGYKALDIDQDLVILEVTDRLDSQGLRTTGMKVSTTDKWPRDEIDAIADQMEEGRVLSAHPQQNVCYYSESFGSQSMSNISGETANYITNRLVFGPEVTLLNNARLRFRTDVFESNSKGVASEQINLTSTGGGGGTVGSTGSGGGTVGTSGSGGGSVATSSGGGVHSHAQSVTEVNYTAGLQDLYYDPNTNPPRLAYVGSAVNQEFIESTESVSTHTHSINVPSHSHSISLPTHNHSINLPVHSHSIDMPSHAHAVSFGIIRQTSGDRYPGGVTVLVNGTQVGGSYGSTTTGTGDIEIEVGEYLKLRNQVNTIEFRCATGQGRLIANLLCFVTVQAILVN